MNSENRSVGPEPERLEGRLSRLIEAADELGGGREQRREQLVERAERRGLDRATAEQAYDLAKEVELEPAFGMALVLEGVSVRPLDSAGADVRASEPSEPEWVDTPPDPTMAARERRLRQTFRRLRSFLEQESGPRAGMSAFAREPDLEPYDY